ncbi:hypothetical protein DICPUDRAFT_152706 [Dictyostelium purpureum]|uniref:Uncharacterized protein n=1 Tax=Dictyostelium purpureum TaxID=5786 RepID=F0ZM30_DICPU|nr:uncharacterized protein DICPUDRAFT_152706 [Dictyostelium purpureum]EGC34997.1 hypothetical protein DICPUDRAFT_152706 [Dictyostelium purpureum]|eukprot:XP_003288471.1 hypothetical protein DICPUDRAFT_152706 [Dictyostelium purpureum]
MNILDQKKVDIRTLIDGLCNEIDDYDIVLSICMRYIKEESNKFIDLVVSAKNKPVSCSYQSFIQSSEENKKLFWIQTQQSQFEVKPNRYRNEIIFV